MKLVQEFVASIDLKPLAAAKYIWFQEIFPLASGRAVIWVSTSGTDSSPWLIEVSRDGNIYRKLPDSIVKRFEAMTRRRQSEEDWFILPFQLGERLGVLLADRVIYLFDTIESDPVKIVIENPFALGKSIGSRGVAEPFSPTRCGSTRTHLLPVMFKDPGEWDDYTGFMSLLDIDVEARSARWTLATPKGHPKPIKFRKEVATIDHHVGSFLHDLCWTGSELLVYSIGARSQPARFGMGMTYSVLLQCDKFGRKVRLLNEADEGCYGRMLHDSNRVLLEPLFKSGKRKGRQTLYDIKARIESPLTMPRGFSKFWLRNARDGLYWAIGDVSWVGVDDSAIDKVKNPRILVCRGVPGA
jgi:hypothetical protein